MALSHLQAGAGRPWRPLRAAPTAPQRWVAPTVPARWAEASAWAPNCACGGGCPRCQPNVNNDGPTGSYLPGKGPANTGPVQPYGPSLPPTEAGDPITTQPAEPQGAAPAAPTLPIYSALKLRQWTEPMGAMPNHEVFGATSSPTPLGWTDLDVQAAPTVDGWVAHGELMHPVYWGALFNRGPTGQADITGVDDDDITAQNCVQVANDLRPDPSGRAPRSEYFSSDLSKKHEQFHVFHHFLYFIQEFREGVAWLNRHAARSARQVLKLVEHMRLRVESRALARLGVDTDRSAEEEAAYAAGREDYQQRSDAIRAKGKAGGYFGRRL